MKSPGSERDYDMTKEENDLFTGSGQRRVAALLEKFNFSGLERDENYHRIAEKRLKGDPQDTLS